MPHLVSIVIPTLNGRDRIAQPLLGLSRQIAVPGPFEVIVVDNHSMDGTADAVMALWATQQLTAKGVPIRVVREDRAGLTAARLRGAREARAPILCFLDDDTEPAPQYLAAGLESMRDERVAVLISRVYPRYESQPSRSTLRREHLLAINHRLGDHPKRWEPHDSLAPTIGAGMWVRRDAFLRMMSQSPALLPDRVGESLCSGGDIEIGIRMGQMGYARLYVPDLVLHHHIPSTRVRWKYFCRLIIGIVRSELTLRQRYPQLPRPPSRARAIAAFLVALLAVPLLLLRRDGLRECAFVLSSRWASVLGPYEKPDDRVPSEMVLQRLT